MLEQGKEGARPTTSGDARPLSAAAVASFVGAVMGALALASMLMMDWNASSALIATPVALFFLGGTVGSIAGVVGVVRCWSGAKRGYGLAVAGFLISLLIGLVFVGAAASGMPSFSGPDGTML
jgi:hypothetical protein